MSSNIIRDICILHETEKSLMQLVMVFLRTVSPVMLKLG